MAEEVVAYRRLLLPRYELRLVPLLALQQQKHKAEAKSRLSRACDTDLEVHKATLLISARLYARQLSINRPKQSGEFSSLLCAQSAITFGLV